MLDLRNLRKRLLVALPLSLLGWWAINSRLIVFPNPVAQILPGQILALILTIGGCAEYTKLLSVSFPRNRFWLVWLWVVMQILLDMFDLSMPLRWGLFLLLFIVAAEAFAGTVPAAVHCRGGGDCLGRKKHRPLEPRQPALFRHPVSVYCGNIHD